MEWGATGRLFSGCKFSWGHNHSCSTDSPLDLLATLTDHPQDCGQPQSFLLGPHDAVTHNTVSNGPKGHPGHVLRAVNSTAQEAVGVL